MTAPMIPTNAPDMDSMDALERTIASTLHESQDLIGDEQAIANRPRNDKGQFVPIAEGQQPAKANEWNSIPDADPSAPVVPVAADASLPEGEGEATPATEPEKPVIPEGFVALPALAPEKVQGFKVFDADGEIVVPDIRTEVNFKSGPRTLDYPQLVNYARMGVYNHEREQQHEQSQRELNHWRATAPQFEQAVQEREQRIERLLSDPAYLASELQRYDMENTPEARAQRERDKLQQDREQFELQQITQQAEAFIDNRLEPALNRMADQFPTISREELAAKLFLAAEPYRFNGVLHPKHFQTVAAYVVHDLYPWAEQLHTDRETRKPAAKPEAKAPAPKANEALQVRAQKARRIGVAPMKPAGSGQPQGGPAAPKTPTNNRGMEEFIVGRSVAATVGRASG